MAKKQRRIAVADAETDPFLHGRIPTPFSWGFFDGEKYVEFWQVGAENITRAFVDYLDTIDEPLTIYMHNGGKFDFYFLLPYIGGNLRIVNGRILEAKLGKHILRDSYAILPIPLRAYQKDDIEYWKMEKEHREKYKPEILSYLKGDCVYLYELVSKFVEEFGDVLTIGSASMREFKKFHEVEQASESWDGIFRPFYFGGRCQAFETGVIKRPVKVFDVNSMYPDTMRRMKHPVGLQYDIVKKVGPQTAFVVWRGDNFGAVPVRTKTGLSFNQESGEFYSSIHEFNAGLETGSIRPHKIMGAFDFEQMITFEAFVDFYYHSRLRAKEIGDKFHDIFYKLILNSSYGKQAQNPLDFKEWHLTPADELMPEPWSIEIETMGYILWTKPTINGKFYNVACAASITGGARSQLLRGIKNATNPIYCDTDSIICDDLSGVMIDDKELGAWKLEAEGDMIAVAGRKLYAVFQAGECIKKAHKGARLTAEQIVAIAGGASVDYRVDAPAFKLDGQHIFVHRTIKSTATI